MDVSEVLNTIIESDDEDETPNFLDPLSNAEVKF